MKAILALRPERFAQAWLVARWMSTSPARIVVSQSSMIATISPSNTERVVHRAGDVHPGVGPLVVLVGVVEEMFEGGGEPGGQFGGVGGFGRHLDDPQHVAVARRQDAVHLGDRIGAVDGDGHGVGRPQVGDPVAGPLRNRADMGRGAVLDDGRAAARTVAGDDATDGRREIGHVGLAW